MIRYAVDNSRAINSFILGDGRINSDAYRMTDSDWTRLKKILEVLELFERATVFLSHGKYPLLPTAIATYNFIIDFLEDREGNLEGDLVGEDKEVMEQALKAAREKIMKWYSKTTGSVYGNAMVLDPTFKLQYARDNHWEDIWIAGTRAALEDTYLHKSALTTRTARSELQEYLESAPLPRYANLELDAQGNVVKAESDRTLFADALEWWKVHDGTFPNGLARMARDFLAIPGTTVDMEREFSKAGDLVVRKRGRLCSETIRANMCLKSWIDNELYDVVSFWDSKEIRM